MKEFEDSVRKGFEEAARRYQNDRLEPLPAKEWAILEEWLSILDQKDEKEAMDILSETFTLTVAIGNGFRPSEYMDSMSNSQIRQLRKLQIEPDDIPISTADIHGPRDFIELTIQLRRWLLSDDRSPTFMNDLANDSEYAFWVGCFLKDSDPENAKESFRIAIEGSLTKRMRIRALQNTAWIFVDLGAFEEAITTYDQIAQLAELQNTKELASECRGYIKALRDHGINEPETEFTFAATPEEFEESVAVRQADEILESLQSKGATGPSSPPTPYLQKMIDEGKGVDSDLRTSLSQQFGFRVDDLLPAEVFELLVDAERSRLRGRSQAQAIVALYDAVESCLNWSIGTRFLTYVHERVQKVRYMKSLSISQWSHLFGSLDEKRDMPSPHKDVGLLTIPFRSFLADNSPSHDSPILLSLSEKLPRIQRTSTPYRHKGGAIASGPRSWTQQIQDLQEMHRLVIGQQDKDSIINQIMRLDISKKT